jgi:hypothetical protein
MSSSVRAKAAEFLVSAGTALGGDQASLSTFSVPLSAVVAFKNVDVYEGDIAELSGSEIRLLLLHAGPFESQITIELVKRRLDESPEFDALSYVWGDFDSHRPHSIRCNGKEFTVTPNLEIALRHMRLENGIRTIWADAISINQANLAERSQQVTMMFRIYQERIQSVCLAWKYRSAFRNHSRVPRSLAFTFTFP